MQGDQIPTIDKSTILDCFSHLYSVHSTPSTRNQANQFLIDLEKNAIGLLSTLLAIFQQSLQTDPLLAFRVMVYFCNVIKRSWTVRRTNKLHSDFQAAKKHLRQKILFFITTSTKNYLPTLFDVLKFILKVDYPHAYPMFSSFAEQVAAQALEEAEKPSEVAVLMLKQLREIFFEISERKGGFSRKNFDEHLRGMINTIGGVSVKCKSIVESNLSAVSSQIIKISKYSDQILIYILRAAPMDIQDEQSTSNMMMFLQEKLEYLLSAHNQNNNKGLRLLLQKNIKSLIYDMGLLQSVKPLILSWTLPKLYECLFYVIVNHQNFVKNACVRYTLIGIRRIIKQFTYYAEHSNYLQSIRSKQTTSNTIKLRQNCHQFYISSFTQSVITNLLNFLLQNPYARSAYEGWAEGEQGIERGQQKQASAQACVVMVVQSLLQRFPQLTHQLIRSLTVSCMQSGWTNIEEHTLHNLLSVVAILPNSCKKEAAQALRDFPVMQILEFVYKTASIKMRFAPIVAGWMDTFDNQQISSLATVLLSFMQQQGENSQGHILVGCCQCINKLISKRLQAINLQEIVQRAVPILLNALGKIQNPDVLWPIVTLISGVVSRAQLQSDIIVSALEGDKLAQLVLNESTLLVQALCDMFKGFLCVIPRNKPAKPVFELICAFLNHNLSRFDQPNHQKIFYLWYITIREYSSVQQCDQLYTEIFENHFRKNLYRKTSTLIYILQQYMLAGLVPHQLDQFVSIIVDCYVQASSLEKQQGEKLKVASLSFQITLITQYDLQQVNSNSMLQLILADFCNFDTQQVSPTIHNSILAIINRYLILYREAFLSYLQTLPLDLPTFLQIYVQNMHFITSRTAAKINAIATLTLLNNFDHVLICLRTHTLMHLIIPEVEHYVSTIQSAGQQQYIGIVDNSPSLRFASNILSQRKEQVRKKDGFETVNLLQLFRSELKMFVQRIGATVEQLAESLQPSWAQRLMKLF